MTAGIAEFAPFESDGGQCEVTDPVSFALARGALVANFPNVPGFSIQDTARRALAEHAAWLGASMGDRGGTVPAKNGVRLNRCGRTKRKPVS